MYPVDLFKRVSRSRQFLATRPKSSPRDIPTTQTSTNLEIRTRKHTPDSVVGIFGSQHLPPPKYNPCSKKIWSKSGSCEDCRAKFNLLKRRHHCRSCGMSICSKCSKEFTTTSSKKKKVILCLTCNKRFSGDAGSVQDNTKNVNLRHQILQPAVDMPEECPVCLEDLDATDKKRKLKTLDCGHQFHDGCIRSWQGRSSQCGTTVTCPVCRISSSWSSSSHHSSDLRLQKRNYSASRLSQSDLSLTALSEEEQLALALSMSISDQ